MRFDCENKDLLVQCLMILNTKGNQSQNVRKAAQIFSHTNAKSILRLSKVKGFYTPHRAQALHDAILIFNDW